jgi:hypothetical protein
MAIVRKKVKKIKILFLFQSLDVGGFAKQGIENIRLFMGSASFYSSA